MFFKSKPKFDLSAKESKALVDSLHSRFSLHSTDHIAKVLALRAWVSSQIKDEIISKSFENPQWVPADQGKEIFLSLLQDLKLHDKSRIEVRNKATNFGIPLPKEMELFNSLWSEALEFLLAEISLSFQPELRNKVLDIWKYSRVAFDEIDIAILNLLQIIETVEEVGTTNLMKPKNLLSEDNWKELAKKIPNYILAFNGK